ncbi:MAG: sigma-54 dependent transcriptional regulator [Spirochaetaceae bacterium]|jgi:two-component system nitrogen regulation response regulator NtrX|nr:sigma-54 dependent transcriptional regulator [Spirochaetaceae bacterium]
MTKILIIDDEPGIRSTLASILEDEGYKVHAQADAVSGLEWIRREPVDLVFLDVLLPQIGGLEALERIRSGWPEIEVVVISGHANVDMAVRAVKLGAFDFLEKPLSLDKVLTVCRNALMVRKLREENRALKTSARIPEDAIIGRSLETEGLRERIAQAATSDARVLILGENGTGKELVARAIHRGSARSSKAFVALNCAAIPDTLIETELFGHEKGAFTDAVSRRKGRFELASGGTLFLDEIGDMSLGAQAKVLRVIQEQQIERLGGEKTLAVDVRIVAATNKDLEQECAAARFRQDLFFRLNVLPIYVPPLRERTADIPELLFHFLRDLGRESYMAEPFELDRGALQLLQAYTWPGNVRELQNLAERILVLHTGGVIGEKTILALLQQSPAGNRAQDSALAPPVPPVPDVSAIMHLKYNEAKESFEKGYLEYQLSQHGGVISRTAEAIGIYPSNLHAKLRKYQIRTER